MTIKKMAQLPHAEQQDKLKALHSDNPWTCCNPLLCCKACLFTTLFLYTGNASHWDVLPLNWSWVPKAALFRLGITINGQRTHGSWRPQGVNPAPFRWFEQPGPESWIEALWECWEQSEDKSIEGRLAGMWEQERKVKGSLAELTKQPCPGWL
jgi:hypothetical protein